MKSKVFQYEKEYIRKNFLQQLFIKTVVFYLLFTCHVILACNKNWGRRVWPHRARKAK